MGNALDVSVNGRTVRVDRRPLGGLGLGGGVAVAVTVLAVALLLPSVAWGDVIADGCKSLAEAAFAAIKGLFSGGDDVTGPADLLCAPFESLLGGTGGSSVMYEAVRAVHNGIKSLAAALLSLVMLMHMVKISQRMDSGSQMPAVKEVLMLAVMCAVWMYVINHSLAIVQALYDQVNLITEYAKTSLGDVDNEALEFFAGLSAAAFVGSGGGATMALLVGWLFLYLCSSVASIAVNFMALGRGIQIYVESMFAPIPLVLLGFDETRSWGVGYIKNLIAVCLSGTIMLIILRCLPIMMMSVFKTEGFALNTDIGNVIVIELVAIVGCFKSGSWARDILGG